MSDFTRELFEIADAIGDGHGRAQLFVRLAAALMIKDRPITTAYNIGRACELMTDAGRPELVRRLNDIMDDIKEAR